MSNNRPSKGTNWRSWSTNITGREFNVNRARQQCLSSVPWTSRLSFYCNYSDLISSQTRKSMAATELVLSLDQLIADWQGMDGLCSGSLSLVHDHLLFLIGQVDLIVNRDNMRFSSPSLDGFSFEKISLTDKRTFIHSFVVAFLCLIPVASTNIASASPSRGSPSFRCETMSPWASFINDSRNDVIERSMSIEATVALAYNWSTSTHRLQSFLHRKCSFWQIDSLSSVPVCSSDHWFALSNEWNLFWNSDE